MRIGVLAGTGSLLLPKLDLDVFTQCLSSIDKGSSTNAGLGLRYPGQGEAQNYNIAGSASGVSNLRPSFVVLNNLGFSQTVLAVRNFP
jgi:hypothetical protein